MNVVIVANAPNLDASPYTDLMQQADLLIAADGGSRAVLACGFTPQIVIGDLDSLDQQSSDLLQQRGVDLRRFPRAKDETDLELAILVAVEQGAQSIDIIGGLGGRWDHSIANLTMLAMPALKGRRVRLLVDQQEICLVRDQVQIQGQIGDTLSLLPLSPEVHGVTTHGLEYALEQATLSYEQARGVSNIMTAPIAEIRIRSGLLLVIHHNDNGAHQLNASPLNTMLQ
jgi:thiamine pyrophosphokinase